ncbi:hypothetical protein B0T20DRAFT_183221 [Sordaria brevicollis]|uniref:Uncharacterized protein n=1 Tax=Sordaria brevicollis TaxID=83679 RepID=A0AAE0UDR5_SORBR|nr:hypothetical protein B0T20DRAFT_183221 [Sordaria brevicollis]
MKEESRVPSTETIRWSSISSSPLCPGHLLLGCVVDLWLCHLVFPKLGYPLLSSPPPGCIIHAHPCSSYPSLSTRSCSISHSHSHLLLLLPFDGGPPMVSQTTRRVLVSLRHKRAQEAQLRETDYESAFIYLFRTNGSTHSPISLFPPPSHRLPMASLTARNSTLKTPENGHDTLESGETPQEKVTLALLLLCTRQFCYPKLLFLFLTFEPLKHLA